MGRILSAFRALAGEGADWTAEAAGRARALDVDAVFGAGGDGMLTQIVSNGCDHAATELLVRLGALGIAGGAVYDALVGAAAVEHGLTLMTRDRRAVDIYRRLDVGLMLLD